MGARLFGTDGVRGLANADLTPHLALSLATAAAKVLVERRPMAADLPVAGVEVPGGSKVAVASPEPSGHPLAVVGRDPRASGEMLEAAVAAGLASAGVDVLRVSLVIATRSTVSSGRRLRCGRLTRSPWLIAMSCVLQYLRFS